MSRAISIRIGAVPWKPADDAEPVIEYDRLDVPTIGVVRQGDTEYLFRCASGHGSLVSVWAYGAIDRGVRDRLEAAADPSSFDSALKGAAKFPAVLAIVADGFGIVATERIDGVTEVHASMGRLFDAFDRWTGRFRLPEPAAVERDVALALPA